MCVCGGGTTDREGGQASSRRHNVCVLVHAQGQQRGGKISTSAHVIFISLKGYLYTPPTHLNLLLMWPWTDDPPPKTPSWHHLCRDFVPLIPWCWNREAVFLMGWGGGVCGCCFGGGTSQPCLSTPRTTTRGPLSASALAFRPPSAFRHQLLPTRLQTSEFPPRHSLPLACGLPYPSTSILISSKRNRKHYTHIKPNFLSWNADF